MHCAILHDTPVTVARSYSLKMYQPPGFCQGRVICYFSFFYCSAFVFYKSLIKRDGKSDFFKINHILSFLFLFRIYSVLNLYFVVKQTLAMLDLRYYTSEHYY